MSSACDRRHLLTSTFADCEARSHPFGGQHPEPSTPRTLRCRRPCDPEASCVISSSCSSSVRLRPLRLQLKSLPSSTSRRSERTSRITLPSSSSTSSSPASLRSRTFPSAPFSTTLFVLLLWSRLRVLTRPSQALAAYAAGTGILTQCLYALAYLTGPSFLSTVDQINALKLMALPQTGISVRQLLKQVALYLGGSPIVECVSLLSYFLAAVLTKMYRLLSINVYFGASAGTAGSSYLSIATCLQHSFSRGSIVRPLPPSPPPTNPTAHHSTSPPQTPSPTPPSTPNVRLPSLPPSSPANPSPDLQHPVDKFFLSKAAQYVRKLGKTRALASFIDSETEPGLAVSTDAQWNSWVENNVRTEYVPSSSPGAHGTDESRYHPIGTASMLPREDGGVVSPKLIVYGTTNVRVVDLSIVPLHVGSHVQTAAYAIAEKAADMIKAAH